MNENQNNMTNTQEEFDISQLFTTVWKHKIVIICVTLIVAILAGIFSKVFLAPKYISHLNIVINMPNTYATKYGDYLLPDTMNQQCVNLITSNEVLLRTLQDAGYDTEKFTLEDFKRCIEVKSTITDAYSNGQNILDVMISMKNPDEAQKLTAALYDNFIEFMDAMTVNRILNYFETHYTVDIELLEAELKKNNEILKYNEEIIKSTPKTINPEETMELLEGRANTGDIIILNNEINDNYVKVQGEIIAVKQLINTLEYSLDMDKKYLEEIGAEIEKINQYYTTGDSQILDQCNIDVITSNIYLPSGSGSLSRPSGSGALKNMVIGAFVGGMFGVLYAFMKEYAKKKK